MGGELVLRQIVTQGVIQGQAAEFALPVPILDRAAGTAGAIIGTGIRYIPVPGSGGRNVGEVLDDTLYDRVTAPAINLYNRVTGRYESYQPLSAEEQNSLRQQRQSSPPASRPIQADSPTYPASSYTLPASTATYSAPQVQSFEAMQAQWEAERLQREQQEVNAAVNVANEYKLTLGGISDRPASQQDMALSSGEYSWDATDRVMNRFVQEAIAFNRNPDNRDQGLRMIAFERTLPNSHIRVPSRVVGTAEQLARWLDPLRQDANGNYASSLLNTWDFRESGVDPDWATDAARPLESTINNGVIAPDFTPPSDEEIERMRLPGGGFGEGPQPELPTTTASPNTEAGDISESIFINEPPATSLLDMEIFPTPQSEDDILAPQFMEANIENIDEGIRGKLFINGGQGYANYEEVAEMDALFVETIYVNESARGGAGRALIERLQQEAGNRGLSQVIVSSTNEAKGFYERVGGTPMGGNMYSFPAR